MEDIKISIIIPAYNSEKYIHECINSILNQTYSNYEIICVDDCSTDTTFKILSQMKNIELYKTKENSKQGAARNIGLNHAKGDYIMFLDADDKFSDDTLLEDIIQKIKKENKPDLIYFGVKITGIRQMEILPTKENTTREYRLAKNKYINVISICWKRELIENNSIRFPTGIKYEDVYFNFLGIEKAKTYSYLSKIGYIYNNRKDSTTTTYSISQAKDTIFLIEKLIDLFDKIDQNDYKYLISRIKSQSKRCNVRLERAIDVEINKKVRKE